MHKKLNLVRSYTNHLDETIFLFQSSSADLFVSAILFCLMYFVRLTINKDTKKLIKIAIDHPQGVGEGIKFPLATVQPRKESLEEFSVMRARKPKPTTNINGIVSKSVFGNRFFKFIFSLNY